MPSSISPIPQLPNYSSQTTNTLTANTTTTTTAIVAGRLWACMSRAVSTRAAGSGTGAEVVGER
jgi:hypothetical protein